MEILNKKYGCRYGKNCIFSHGKFVLKNNKVLHVYFRKK